MARDLPLDLLDQLEAQLEATGELKLNRDEAQRVIRRLRRLKRIQARIAEVNEAWRAGASGGELLKQKILKRPMPVAKPFQRPIERLANLDVCELEHTLKNQIEPGSVGTDFLPGAKSLRKDAAGIRLQLPGNSTNLNVGHERL